jgi:cytochrome c-type biogenesis protein CcmH
MRRWLPWLVLAAVVLGALGVLVARSQPSESVEARARRLERELACPVCAGEALGESNAPEARAMRVDLRERLVAGESDSEIVAVYVARYGEDVSLKPGDDGIALLAWGIPVIVVLAGGAGLVIALRRWSREPRLEATADDEAIVAREREA